MEVFKNLGGAVPFGESLPDWSPSSWQAFPCEQAPLYRDLSDLKDTKTKLKDLPPLVFSGEVLELKKWLKLAQQGEAFILQGGDCAESFRDNSPDQIARKVKILLQVSLVLRWALQKPVVIVARMAGQYAKPRSNLYEGDGLQRLMSYRGDMINGFEATLASRTPDPKRLLLAYQHSLQSLNFSRALQAGGFFSPQCSDRWQFEQELQTSPSRIETGERLRQVIAEIHDFMRWESSFATPAPSVISPFFVSHEALSLDYEECFVRKVPHLNEHYLLSTHWPWIGNRTRSLGSAQVEFCRGIANPVSVKLDDKVDFDQILKLIERLNPHRQEAKLCLVTRLGSARVRAVLPEWLKALKQYEAQHGSAKVLWMCDPMHGNTFVSNTLKQKSRRCQDIFNECLQTAEVHKQSGSRLNGIHFEMTGDDVTECVGVGVEEMDLRDNYTTLCDPRLNYHQSLDLAFQIADHGSLF